MDSKNHYFWTWFLENEKQLRMLRSLNPKLQKHFTFWLDWHLHFYAPGIDYILVFPVKDGDRAEIIITANGDPAHFGKVEDLVSEAPAMNRWKITAFVQPVHDIEELKNGLDKPYVMHDITLKASELKFVPFEEEGSQKLDLIIYLRQYTMFAQGANLLQLVFYILQDTLGEKVLFENIGFVQLAQLPEDDGDFLHIYELQYYIDEINRSRSTEKS